MRFYMGSEINEDYVDNLVEEWRENALTMPVNLEEFVTINTGWTHAEYAEWVKTAELPE